MTFNESVADRIRIQLAAGALRLTLDEKIPTLGEYFEKWIKSQHHLKHSTIKSYNQLFGKHLIPLTDSPLDSITRP